MPFAMIRPLLGPLYKMYLAPATAWMMQKADHKMHSAIFRFPFSLTAVVPANSIYS